MRCIVTVAYLIRYIKFAVVLRKNCVTVAMATVLLRHPIFIK